jgi:hypothetical protein
LDFVDAPHAGPTVGSHGNRGRRPAWCKHPAIQGFGITRAGNGIGRLMLTVFVDSPRCRLRIPRRITIVGMPPAELAVRTIGLMRASASDDIGPFAMPQLSIRREGGGVGTAGCIVGKPGTTERHLLSCAHVMALNILTEAGLGNAIYGPVVDATGKFVASPPKLAELVNWSPQTGDDGSMMDVDGASAKIVDGALFPDQVRTPRKKNVFPSVQDQVYFFGAKSGRQAGTIAAINKPWGSDAYVTVNGRQLSYKFSGLIFATGKDPATGKDVAFSVPGDSGAAVYRQPGPGDAEPLLIGLIMGSGTSGSVICPIGTLLKRFGLDLISPTVAPAPLPNHDRDPNPNPSPSPSPSPALTPLPPLAVNGPATGRAIDKLTSAVVAQVMMLSSTDMNIRAYLPKVKAALIERGLVDAPLVAMAISTVRVESAGFSPISEGRSSDNTSDLSDETKWFDQYDDRNGNTGRADAQLYFGRGFVQLTGRNNYRDYGKLIHVDLLDRPNDANLPTNAARILAFYLSQNLSALKDALGDGTKPNLIKARSVVNGGNNGQTDFENAYNLCFKLLS